MEFAESTYIAAEADGTVELCINLIGELETQVEVVLFTVDDNSSLARPDSDYRSTNITIVFGSGSSLTECRSMQLIEDSTLENEESFLVNISSENSAVRVLLGTAEVIIGDSDSKFFTIGPYASLCTLVLMVNSIIGANFLF